MRSDQHFTHDGRPESEDGQPTHEHGHGHGHGHSQGHGHGHGHGPHCDHGFGAGRGHGFGPDGHRRPTLARSIVKSARRIRRSGLTPEQLQHRIAATVSHADYVTTMRTLRRIGMDLRHQH